MNLMTFHILFNVCEFRKYQCLFIYRFSCQISFFFGWNRCLGCIFCTFCSLLVLIYEIWIGLISKFCYLRGQKSVLEITVVANSWTGVFHSSLAVCLAIAANRFKLDFQFLNFYLKNFMFPLHEPCGNRIRPEEDICSWSQPCKNSLQGC